MSNPYSSKSTVQHTVAAGETLSGIALKYYGSAAKEKWMLIYEANKETIGDNPNLIRPGMVLNIPSQDTPSTPSQEELQGGSGRPSPSGTEEQKDFH